MLLYAPIKLKCVEMIKSVTAEYMEKFNVDHHYTNVIPFSAEQFDSINSEMIELGLPKIRVKPLSFKRRSNGGYQYKLCHLDGPYNGVPIKASIVIPVSGCDETEQYWYDGDYSWNISVINSTDSKYCSITWNSPPKLIGKVEILNGPMLCRTDIPHSAYGNGREYRTTCTLRFEENPSFEEILDRFNLNK